MPLPPLPSARGCRNISVLPFCPAAGEEGIEQKRWERRKAGESGLTGGKPQIVATIEITSSPDLAEGVLEANPPISAGALCDILSLRQATFLMGLWERPGLPFHLYLLPAPLSSTASPYDIPLNYLDW